MSDTCNPDTITLLIKIFWQKVKEVYNFSKWVYIKNEEVNEIAKEKVFYTTFVVLILSSFMLQTGKADEVQVKSDEAKIDYVNSEASAP